MRLPITASNRIKRDKHAISKVFILTTAVAFTIVSSLPTNALAFESGLGNSVSHRLVAPVEVVNDSSELVVVVAAHVPSKQEKPAEQILAAAPAIAPNPAPIPETGSVLVLEGEASYYSRAGCLGCHPAMIMANGQPLNDNALTMAIGANNKHLVGRAATVTSLATGKSVRVTITDTGGFYQAKYGHRVADLTIATKQAIGMAGGVGQVRVEVH